MEPLRPELIAELACATARPEQFEREVLTLIERQIGADVSFFCSPRGVSEATIGLDRRVLPRAWERWAQMSSEVERLRPAALSSGGVVVDSELLGAELPKLVYYDTFMRPYRGRTTLFGFLHYQGRGLAELVLGRAHGSPDFRPAELARLRALLPTLSLAWHGYSLARAPDGAGGGHSEPGTWPARAPERERAWPELARSLSGREREVWSYLRLGYTNQQIALALGSAPRTVRNQLSRVYEKLGVASRAEAVAAWHGSNVPWSARLR